MSPENQWLEDVLPTEIVPFYGTCQFSGVYIVLVLHFCEKSCNLEGDLTLESWTKIPTGYLLPAIQPLWQVPNVLRGRGG